MTRLRFSISSSPSSCSPSSSSSVLLLVVVVVVVCLLGLARADLNVTLLHSQDNFGAVVPLDSGNAPCKPLAAAPYYSTTKAGSQCYGGLARRSGVVAQVRAEAQAQNRSVLLLDAGNANVGSLFYLTFGSEVIATYYADMGYDAVKIEVHDFISRVAQVANFSRVLAPIPVVSANVVNLNEDARFVAAGGAPIQPYAVVDLGPAASGQRVGYVGTTAVDLGQFFGEPGLIDSTAELPAMRNTVALLQNMGINKIVAAVSGPNVVDAIVNEVPGIDVLIVVSDIYGTNLTTITTPTSGPYPTVRQMPWGQPVLIVGTGANNGKFIGRLDLVFDDFGVIKSWGGAPVLLDDSSPVDTVMQADIVQRQQVVNNQSTRVVGQTLVDLAWENDCMFGECTIGLWTTDAMRRAAPEAQIAWYNGGSMYAPIHPGNITLGQVQTAMPLLNSELHTCELAGEYIWAAMENSLLLVTNRSLNINQGIGRFLSVSGMRMLYNPDEQPGSRVVELWLESGSGGLVTIDRAASYVIAVFRYLWAGGDGFTVIPDHCQNSKPKGVPALSVWLNDLELHSPVGSLTGGRLEVTTTLSRRHCLAADGQVCSGNGYCYVGACQCTVAGAAGPLCSLDSASTDPGSSGSTLSSGSIAGIVVGAAAGGCCVLLVVIVVTALLASMRKRPVEQEWMIDFDELEMGDLLGRGGFGEVHKGRWKGTEVAVKTISAEHITREMKSNFIAETSIMSRLRHPNVVLFMAASTKPPLLCIVMEYMALGSLYDLLHNELVADIPFQLKLKLMYQAAKGMHFLHSSGVAHRDLKSLNLLLDNKWNVKVADFGLTVFKDSMRRKGDERRDSQRNGDGAVVGSVPWMAPELLQETPDADFVLADVYAYGIIMWEVFTRKKPYDGLTAPQVAVSVIRNDLRPTLPHAGQLTEAERQYVELLGSCWHRDTTVRPVFLDVMNDIVKIGNANGGSGGSSGNMFSSSTYGSSSSASSAAHHFSKGGNSHSKSSAGSSSTRSDYASGEVVGAAAKGEGGAGVPRRDVSFVVCDLARFDDVWRRDPAGADRAIGQFGKLVRLRCGVHGGHVFSQPSFHSGGTFMISFVKPAKAAAFALELQYEVAALAALGASSSSSHMHTGLLRDHARVSVAFRPGLTMAPPDDRTRTTYEPKDYEDVLRLNTCCPPGAVVCSPAFRDSYAQTRTAGVGEQVGFVERRDGSVLMVREGEEPVDRHEYGDDEDEDDDDDGNHHSNDMALRDREAGVCSSNMCPWIINTDRIELGERIGEGNYGQVLEGVYHGRKVAIKRLFNSRLDDEGMRRMRKEAAILSGIDHPRVVKLMGLSVADGKLMLVMELVPRGSLRTLLSGNTVLKWSKRLAMLRDAAVGLAFLHSKGIVHRDIKSSNLLVDDHLSVKVGDFGFATAKQDNGTMTRCGTPSWTAPEVLAPSAAVAGSSASGSSSSDNGGAKGSVSEKADVYSFGVVMWEVLTRRVPYEDGNMMTVALDVLQGKRPKVPNDCPARFAEIMQRCWHQKPQKRPTMDDVLMYLNSELKDFV